MGALLRLLMVGEQEDDALGIVSVLRNGGYEPALLRVATSDELRIAISDRTWDVVVADHGLAGLNALEVFPIDREALAPLVDRVGWELADLRQEA